MPTAIVTGGSKRIGRSITLFLAQIGYNIIISYKNSEKDAEETKFAVEKVGRRCHLLKCDLSNVCEMEVFIKNALLCEGDISLLVNNASVFSSNTLSNTSTSQLMENFHVNFFAPYILTTSFSNLIGKGNIINIIDSKAVKNGFKYSAYTLSKKSLFDLTLQSANELGPNIRVNGIAPGFILAAENDDEDYFKELSLKNPLNKSCSLVDINKAVDFILQNNFLTGQIIFVDGGRNLVTGE